MIANALGVSAYHCSTVAHIVTVIMGETGSGYASATAIDVSALDPEAVSEFLVLAGGVGFQRRDDRIYDG